LDVFFIIYIKDARSNKYQIITLGFGGKKQRKNIPITAPTIRFHTDSSDLPGAEVPVLTL
jgi:hypothetical protein